MTYELRMPRDFSFGQLSASATISDVTLSSTAFTSLPIIYTTAQYLPIVLLDAALGVYEIVYITGHASSSANVTVVRGREGSTARAWPSSTQWRAAPTVRDTLIVSTRAALPGANDAHLGLRASVSDEGGRTAEYTQNGWLGTCRQIGVVARTSDTVTADQVLDTVTANLQAGRRYRATLCCLVSLATAPPPYPSLRFRYAAGATLTTAGTLFLDFNCEVSTVNRPVTLMSTFVAPTTAQYTVGLSAASTINFTISGTGRQFTLEDTGN